jgi:hypothetical protein
MAVLASTRLPLRNSDRLADIRVKTGTEWQIGRFPKCWYQKPRDRALRHEGARIANSLQAALPEGVNHRKNSKRTINSKLAECRSR